MMQNSSVLIQREIRRLLQKDFLRLTPTDVIRHVQRRHREVTRADIKSAIAWLLGRGRLKYSLHNGLTHLESGRAGAVRISERILIASAGERPSIKDGQIVVRISGGASFGNGAHPTTRLALRGLDKLLKRLGPAATLSKMAVMDIGTGSGVLAIAALLLGIGRALALDNDLLACHEAAVNAANNRVQDKITLAWTLADIPPGAAYDILLANLRPPTLVGLAGSMAALTKPGGYWVLSGFRSDECAPLQKSLPGIPQPMWSATDRGWAAAVYQPKSFSGI